MAAVKVLAPVFADRRELITVMAVSFSFTVRPVPNVAALTAVVILL